MRQMVAACDVPGRARPFDRPVLRPAKLRHDRGGRRSGAGKRARGAALYDSHLRDESSYSIGARRRGGRGDPDRPGGAFAGQHLPHQGARRRRSGPGADDHRPYRGRAARPASISPPINIPGRPRARASPLRWCRAGRMTAGGPPCCARFDDPSVAARLHADMAENLRRRGGAESLLITEGQYRGHRLCRGRPDARRRTDRGRDRDHAGRRCGRGLLQSERGRTSPPSWPGPG